jgi:glycosyltransferase involved in cell wall biosynthesis
LGHRHFFSAEELYKEFSELQKRYPACFVGTPFGHDLVDIRNDIHLNWNFSESPKWQSYEDVHPKVSVIIPVYNRKEFLMKIISSLSDQTLSQHEFEVLILDDGGTDQLEEELVKECGKKSISNIKYYYLPRDIELTSEYIGNRVGPIRNFGASQARSEILLFLDSDILLERDYLDKIMLAHKNADVVLPKRVYLSKEVTQNILSSSSKYKFDSKDELITPWQGYLDDFYNSGNWQIHGTPWKYFMTYCLSIQKSLFIKAGGFRTNYISYGYEDLDLGYRIIKLNPKLQFLVEKVYHLYHFDQKSSEYGMIKAFRKFQLAMTSRTFVAQNQTFQIEYLRNMTILDQWIQYPIFFWFLLRWKLRRIKMYSFFNNFIHPKKNFYNFNE